jgi:hypothetical protein
VSGPPRCWRTAARDLRGRSEVCACQLTRQGGTRRGNRASREVFPLDGSPPRDSPCVNAGSSGATNADDNYRWPHTLPASVVGRRAVPPAWRRRSLCGRQQQSRGVSDHPKWPLGLPSLRPGTWSLTPRLNSLSVSVSAPIVDPLVRENRRNLENNSMNCSSCLLTLVARALSHSYTPQIFSTMSRTS